MGSREDFPLSIKYYRGSLGFYTVSDEKDGRETVISVIYKKGVIVLFLLNCIFSKVFRCKFYMFSRFSYQAGGKPYSSQDPSMLVPRAAIAHTPFSSAQDNGESLV